MLLGGKVTIVTEGQLPQELSRFDDLPEQFAVQRIDLHEIRPLWLDDLAIPEVTELVLNDSGVSPASIRRLPQLFPNLTEIELAGTAIGNREATALTEYKSLELADLTRTGVTDLGGIALEKKSPNSDIFWGNLPPSPDVEAAKWIIEIGGSVIIQEKGKPQLKVDKEAELPQGPFRLKEVAATMNPHMNDQEITRVYGLRYLRTLVISGHSLTDAGVPVFESIPSLSNLQLSSPLRPGITDKSMISLRKLRRLNSLWMGDIPITTEGLHRYGRNDDLTMFAIGPEGATDDMAKVISEQFPNLTVLVLPGGTLGDSGLKEIAKLTKLVYLVFESYTEGQSNNGHVSDVGLEYISTLPVLRELGMSSRGITDKGLDSVKHLPNLQQLTLRFTYVTDAGVRDLIEMKSLTTIDLRNTAVTLRGLKRLKEARPEITIIEPDRLVWIRGMFETGAKLTVATKAKKGIAVLSMDDLPKIDFIVQIVDYNNHDGELWLPKIPKDDADAVEFRLANTKFHGQGLYGIALCKSLQILDLTNTNVSDEHLSFLHGVKTLQRTAIPGMGIVRSSFLSLPSPDGTSRGTLGSGGIIHT